MAREPTRRGLILGAGVAAAAAHLVKAEAGDLLEMPRSLHAAKRWVTGQFSEYPGVRVVYSNGAITKWHYYNTLKRPGNAPEGCPATFLVAIEVCVTDADGRRAINTVPVDGVGIYNMKHEASAKAVQKGLLHFMKG